MAQALELLLVGHLRLAVEGLDRALDRGDEAVGLLVLGAKRLELLGERGAARLAVALEQGGDVGERRAHAAEQQDLLQAVDVLGPVVAIPAVRVARRVEQAELVVVAQGEYRDPGEVRELGDRVFAVLPTGVSLSKADIDKLVADGDLVR